nr:reverse transcriptase domain-containing protein [Tanacetum cinerariifolium]
MADQRTMAELLQVPTEGYGNAIVIPAIHVENFNLKHDLLNLVTSKQFCGFEKEDPHAHIRWFNKTTSTIKYKDVPNASIKLMLFLFSIEGAARKLGKILFPTADGNLLSKTPKDALTLIENKSKVRTLRNRPVVAKVSTNTSTSGLSPDVAALTDAVKALLLKNTTPPPASVKAVEESCVTCGGPHPYYQCLATDGKTFPGYQDNIQAYVSAAAVNYNQGNAGHRPPSVAHQVRPPGFSPVQNNQNHGIITTQEIRLTEPRLNQLKLLPIMLQQNNKLENMLSNYFQINKPSSLGSLPSNTVANPKGDLKAITIQSGVSYDGPSIPLPPKLVEREPEVTKDTIQPNTKKVQTLDVQTQEPTSETVNAHKPRPNLPYPLILNNQKL